MLRDTIKVHSDKRHGIDRTRSREGKSDGNEKELEEVKTVTKKESYSNGILIFDGLLFNNLLSVGPEDDSNILFNIESGSLSKLAFYHLYLSPRKKCRPHITTL